MGERATSAFFESGFMPHIHCYLGQPALVWTMFFTDLLIGTAYVAISLTLWSLVRRIQLKFNAVVICFGVFILACGLTHFMEDWTLWHPDYWTAAAVKVVTAIASVGTGIYLYRLRHTLFHLAESAKLAEQRRLDLEALTHHLEARVEERTREVTEHRWQLEEALNSIPDRVAIVNREHRFELVNARFEEWLGVAPGRAVGRHAREIFGEESYAQIKKLYAKALAGETVRFEGWVEYAKAGRRYVSVSYQPRRSSSGEVIGIFVYGDDLTERLKTQERLALQEGTLEQIFADSPGLLFYVTGPDHVFARVNRNYLKLTGLAPSILGKPMREVRRELAAQGLVAHLDEVYRSGQTQIGKAVPMLVHRDGKVIEHFVDYVHQPVKDADGRVQGIVAYGYLVTDQVHAHNALQQAIQARDEFMSVASHELKTPLTSLQLQSQLRLRMLARSDSFTPEKLRHMFETDVRYIRRITRLIEEMLDISRLDAGKFMISPDRFDLCELVQDVLVRTSLQFEAAGCEVRLESCQRLEGEWDRFRLEQVLTNLINNALKYGPGKPVTIRIGREGDRAQIVIRGEGATFTVELPISTDKRPRAVTPRL